KPHIYLPHLVSHRLILNTTFIHAKPTARLRGISCKVASVGTRLERFHHTIKDVLQKSKRLLDVIRTLVNIVLLRLSDRPMKQNIRELRFSTKSKHPLLQNYAKSISPYAWSKLKG
ncbi:Uncharacterized protein APZ42_009961, partial [Daphnia magna]